MVKTGTCPVCGAEMNKNNRTGDYYCETCEKTFVKRANCDKCGNEAELLASCGAAQFFCNHCNELKSKKDLDFFFKEKK